MKTTLFIHLNELPTQAHLEQIAKIKRLNLNCRKTVSLTFIIASIARNYLQDIIDSVEIQENTMKTNVFFYFDELPLMLA